MNRRPSTNPIQTRQQGVALVVSLMLLTVITMLSLTAMRSANLDTKIAVNHQHKQLAFQASENAFAQLTSLSPAQMQTLNIPGIIGDYDTNTNVEANNHFIAIDPNAHSGADLDMTLTDISSPGQYKFSGFGLNIVTVVFQADALGEVAGTNATAHNRMEVALIRE